MASKARYVDGDVNLITVLADPDYPCEKGDLMYLHPATGKARPASALNAQGTQALDQLGFAKEFLGVANEKNGLQVGETTFKQNGNVQKTITVCTTGRFEFDCPAQVWTKPVPVGVYSEDGSGCEDQKVDVLKGTAALAQAIGVAYPSQAALESGASMDRVVVDIMGRRPLETTLVAGDYTGTSGQ